MENKKPIIMRGVPVAEHMLTNLTWDSSTTLYILSNQEDPASAVYVRNKKKKCEEVGIRCSIADISQLNIEEVMNILDNISLSFDFFRRFIILQKPLPKQLRPYEKYLDSELKNTKTKDVT